ncbi:DNA topoisomerase (ATP-hydrolyzing) subunit B [Candidatus Babeliales bacterium]|nr:DNA topoisomerase (ATP-hydrolyzing) subunit B [Candidatus Babeliales bacterium]
MSPLPPKKKTDKASGEKDYTATSIKVLEGLEGVRKRPAMYIGTTDSRGLHHLVNEVVDNSVDEALAEFCDRIEVVLHTDNSCSVLDNGRGIPVDIHPKEKISAAEVVMTKLHAGGKFGKDSYKYSGGLHGVGVSVVNALSEWVELEIYKDGKKHYQKYKRGKAVAPLKEIGETKQQGTYTRFAPDPDIFETSEFSFETIASRLREKAFLNRGLTIVFKSEITSQEETFFFEGGIASFVADINSKKNILFPNVVEFNKDDGEYILDFAFQYTDGYSEQTYSFVNNVRTTDGGTHEAGLRAALTKVCNKYAQKLKITKDKSLSSDDVREGLVCVLSLKVPEAQFEGQTKTKLGNSEVKGLVDSWIYSFLDTYFEEQPGIAKRILQKAAAAQQARSAAKKARELTRRKTALESSVLPGKLADCSEEDATKTELFIVEGDSAGGSAKQARNRFIQAILPLRGKILNVEKARLDRALSNNEIKDLITAIGAGVGEDEFNVEKVRYHKTVIMTDADVDGAHIRILLMTFFFRYMKPLIEAGYLYVAQPPLYKVKIGKAERYLQDEFALKDFFFNWAKENVVISFGEKQLSTDQNNTLLNALKAYEDELEKIRAHFEISMDQCHQLIAFLQTIEWKLGGFDLDEIIKKMHEHFPEYSIESHTENEDTSEKPTEESEIDEQKPKHIQPLYIFITHEKKRWSVPLKFFNSEKTAQLLELYKTIEKEDQTEWNVTLTRKNTSKAGKGILRLGDAIVALGKTLMTLQRYKGLGEMNPEQLWETTMDPTKRIFLQVTIEDAVTADQAFTSLMGDCVEDRQVFIEKHAHFVRNLDI